MDALVMSTLTRFIGEASSLKILGKDEKEFVE